MRVMRKEPTSPSPLGLTAAGITTVILSLHNIGLYPLDSMTLATCVFCGGLAQMIAGVMEFRKTNTFAATAYTLYGAFWLTMVALLVSSRMDWQPPNTVAVGWHMILWGVFSAFMCVGARFHNIVLQFVLGGFSALFFLSALGEFTGIVLADIVAGAIGVVAGAGAIYLAMARLLNEEYGRVVLPIGKQSVDTGHEDETHVRALKRRLEKKMIEVEVLSEALQELQSKESGPARVAAQTEPFAPSRLS